MNELNQFPGLISSNVIHKSKQVELRKVAFDVSFLFSLFFFFFNLAQLLQLQLF